MGIEKHNTVDIATSQLHSSICLFLSGRDLFSSITLAGAADVLLCRIVEKQGKENFTAHVLNKENNPKKSIAEMGREINNMFHINALKHMDDETDDSVTMNLREAAIGAILKALPNYVMLRGRDEEFVKSFLMWITQNLDPEIYNVDCAPDWKSKDKES